MLSVQCVTAMNIPKFKSPVVAAFGNPLLDVCVKIEDSSIYEKFGLLRDGQKELTGPELQSIYNFFKNQKYAFEYSVGGCAQNTLRVFQWLIKIPNVSLIFGSVGNDDHGKILSEKVSDDGVVTRYREIDDSPTGTCISLINGTDRSLVAHLGAANIYTVLDFVKPENIELFNTIQLVYIEAFFITHSFDVALEVVELCKVNGIAVVFNICGVYIFENSFKEILHMIDVADIVIGNCNEYNAFWNCYDFGKNKVNIENILTKLQRDKIAKKKSTGKGISKLKLLFFEENEEGNILICTQASKDVLCVYGNNRLIKVPPDNIDESCIKDTTGAGDTFAGGFLAGIALNKSILESIELGCWAAGQIIQRIGCSIPNES